MFLILCNSPPGSRLPIHRSSQARVLEWVVISSSRRSSRPRVEPTSPAWQADSLPLSHLGSPKIKKNNMCMLSHIRKISQINLYIKSSENINELITRETGDAGLIPGWVRSPRGGNGKPTPVFLLGESHGQKSLVGHSPWGHKEMDTT